VLVAGSRAFARGSESDYLIATSFIDGRTHARRFGDGPDRLLANDTWWMSCTILEPDDPCESNHPFLGFSDRPLALAFASPAVWSGKMLRAS